MPAVGVFGAQSLYTEHAAVRAQQRGVPPLIEQWLDEFGEEEFDGRGAGVKYFSHRSVRRMERAFGAAPVRHMARYLDVYKVESVDGDLITIGHRSKRIFRQ